MQPTPLHGRPFDPLLVQLSGDGRLSQDAFLPTSTLPSAYQSLNIYLVSDETNVNLTVSQGPQLLQQEPGSTVRGQYVAAHLPAISLHIGEAS